MAKPAPTTSWVRFNLTAENTEFLTALLINVQVLDEVVQDGDEGSIRDRVAWLLRCWHARPDGLINVRHTN